MFVKSSSTQYICNLNLSVYHAEVMHLGRLLHPTLGVCNLIPSICKQNEVFSLGYSIRPSKVKRKCVNSKSC